MKHIVLIGFMGSGKSTMGRLIANKLNCPFVDTDHYIEKKEGRSISEIFADDGEEYFRNLETETVKELLMQKEKTVIAFGGGTPLKEENRELLRKAEAYVVFLKVTGNEAYERLKGDTQRPLLNVANPREKIDSLLEVRNPIYESVSDYVLLEEKKTLDDIYYELSEVVRGM